MSSDPRFAAKARARKPCKSQTGELIMSLASLKTTSEKVDTGEILDMLGPRIQFMTALSDNDNDYCLIKGSVPPGVVVPLHSHPERESFYALEGEVEGFWKDRWITLGVGDPFDVPGGLKHGWRNLSNASAMRLK
jgi:quercetin dioxygenase-like cupin family protein